MKENINEEVVVLKDLQETDIVFLKLNKPTTSRAINNIKVYYERELRCKVIMLTPNVDIVKVKKENKNGN